MVFGRNTSNLLPVGLFDTNYYSSPGKKKRDKLRLASSGGGGGGEYAGFGRLADDDDDATETERFAHRSPAHSNPNHPREPNDSATLTDSVQSATTSSYYTVTPLELQHLQEFGSLLNQHSLGVSTGTATTTGRTASTGTTTASTTTTTTATAAAAAAAAAARSHRTSTASSPKLLQRMPSWRHTANQTNANQDRHDKHTTKNVWNINGETNTESNTTKTKTTTSNGYAKQGPRQRSSRHQDDNDDDDEDDDSIQYSLRCSPPSHKGILKSSFLPPKAISQPKINPPPLQSYPPPEYEKDNTGGAYRPPHRPPHPTNTTMRRSVGPSRPPEKDRRASSSGSSGRPFLDNSAALPRRRPPSRSTSQDSFDVGRHPPSRSKAPESLVDVERRPPSRSYSQESVDVGRRPPPRSTSQDSFDSRRPPSRSYSQESVDTERRPPSRSYSQESVDTERRPPSRSYSEDSFDIGRRPPSRSTSQDSFDMGRRPPSRSYSQESVDTERRPPSRSYSQESGDTERRPPSRSYSQESVDVGRRPSSRSPSKDSFDVTPSRSISQKKAEEQRHPPSLSNSSADTQRQRRPRTDSDDDSFVGNTSRNSRSRIQNTSAKEYCQPKRRPPRSAAFRGSDEQSVVSNVSRRSFLGNPFSTLSPHKRGGNGADEAVSPRRGRRPNKICDFDDDDAKHDNAPVSVLYQPPFPPQPIKSWSSTFFPKSAPHMSTAMPLSKSSRPTPKAVQTSFLSPRASPQKTFIKPPQPTIRKIKKPPMPPPKNPSFKLQTNKHSNRRPSNTASSSSTPKKRFVQPTTLENEHGSYPDEHPAHQKAPTPANPYLTLAHQCDTWNGMVIKPEMKCPERSTGQLDQFRFDHNHTQKNDDKDSEEEDSSIEMNRYSGRSNNVGSHISSEHDLEVSSDDDESSHYSDPTSNDAASLVVTDDDESDEVQRKIARMTSGQLRKWDGFRDQVTALVSQAMPDHLSQVSDLMQQFSGREAELVQTLQTVCQRLASIPKYGVAVHRSRGSIQCDETSARRTSTIVGRKIDAIASIAAASTLDDQMQTIKAEYILDEPKEPTRRRRQDEYDDYDDDHDDDFSGSYSYSDERDDSDGDDCDDVEYDEDDFDDDCDDGEGESPNEDDYDKDDQYHDDYDDEATDDHDEESQSHACDVEDHSTSDDEDECNDEDQIYSGDDLEDDEVAVEDMHKAYQHRSESTSRQKRGMGRKPSADWSFGGQSHQTDEISKSAHWQ